MASESESITERPLEVGDVVHGEEARLLRAWRALDDEARAEVLARAEELGLH